MKQIGRILKLRGLTPALIACLAIPAITIGVHGQQGPQLTIQWDKATVVSKSTPTLQVVVNPPLRHGEPLSIASYKAVKELGADYVRYVPWLPYPKLAVAELEPPTAQKTSWDFSLIDPMTKDFLEATEGHPTVMNFSTIPTWLFKTDKPVTYPSDPNQVFWDYTQGTELRDPSGKELGDYYNRLVSWYVDGGFTDENGVRHDSGYHYKFPVWEVLNEVEFEHSDDSRAVHPALRLHRRGDSSRQPEHEVHGDGAGYPEPAPGYFEYFLESQESSSRRSSGSDFVPLLCISRAWTDAR